MRSSPKNLPHPISNSSGSTRIPTPRTPKPSSKAGSSSALSRSTKCATRSASTLTNAAADRPMVLTATGYVPIEAGMDAPGAKSITAPLVQKYSPDQPRVPAGNADGGQWTASGPIQVAPLGSDAPHGGPQSQSSDTPSTAAIRLAAAGGLPCDGYSAGCQSGGTYGTTAMYRMNNLNLCTNCAVKYLGIENETPREQLRVLDPFLILR